MVDCYCFVHVFRTNLIIHDSLWELMSKSVYTLGSKFLECDYADLCSLQRSRKLLSLSFYETCNTPDYIYKVSSHFNIILFEGSE